MLRGTLMTLTYRGQKYVVNNAPAERKQSGNVVYRGQKLTSK
ncbi:hypothetical protein SynNOUM97013_01765 [Synechococcus sp. NOUM97013]|nr:hypothetical protein SynNOUM97013_01765 [Synechococcus sp. NOUM97013]